MRIYSFSNEEGEGKILGEEDAKKKKRGKEGKVRDAPGVVV